MSKRNENRPGYRKTKFGWIPCDWRNQCLIDADCEIIDGDRGRYYPKQSDFSNEGYCLFLNASNVTKEGFNFDQCSLLQ